MIAVFVALAMAGSLQVVDRDTGAAIPDATVVARCPGEPDVVVPVDFGADEGDVPTGLRCVGTVEAPGYEPRTVHLDRLGLPPHRFELRAVRTNPLRESVVLLERACFERLGVDREGDAVRWWFERSDGCGAEPPRRWQADGATTDWERVEAALDVARRPRAGARQVTAFTRIDGRRARIDLSTDGRHQRLALALYDGLDAVDAPDDAALRSFLGRLLADTPPR
jgi:hypothetical protein